MKRLKVGLITTFIMNFMLFSSILPVSASSFESNELETVIDKVMQNQMEKLHIPNATVSVVASGKVILEKGYGNSDLNEQSEVDPETTMFRIGSISKLFTWTAVMQLVEQDKLDLDADINQYLDFEIPARLEAFGESEPEPITLTHLMTHTPGFEDYADAIFRLSSESTIPLDQYVRTYMPARVFPAGEVAAYSNYGTALAGYIVEQVSGMSFSDYMEQNIFIPLQMKHSTFLQPLPEELSPNMAQAYRYVDGEYREGKFEFVPGPAGGMSSTAADMAQFMIAYLQEGNGIYSRILEDKTVQQMFHQHFTHHPRLDGMALGFIERTSNEKRILFHGGSTTLFDSGLYLLPDENIGLFISYSGGNYLTHTEIFQAFMDHYFPSTKTMNPSLLPPEGSFERSKEFIGEYHQNRKSFTTSEKFVSLTMGMIHIDLDLEGYLLVNHAMETNRFVEVEPGIYHNLREGRTQDAYGNFQTIVFQTDPFGNTMLTTDGPMTYSKAPWYATSSFTFLFLILIISFILLTLIYWGIAALIRSLRRKKTQYPKIALVAKWLAIAYGILILGIVFGVLLTGSVDPIYQLPKGALGIVPSWSPLLNLFPIVMAFLGVIMVIFTGIILWKKYWNIKWRIHYTLLTGMAVNLLWIFGYWNLL